MATAEKPLLGLLIDLDPLVLNEVTAQLDGTALEESANPVRALFSGTASEMMLEAAVRLAKLLQMPEDARALGPWAVREILYHLLKGPEGFALCMSAS